MRMNITLLLAAALTAAAPSDVAAAQADYSSLSYQDQIHTRYVSLSMVPEAHRETWEKVLCFTVPSTSRGLNLDRQIPRRLGESWVYALDLDALEWGQKEYAKLLKDYPYSVAENPILHGPWLIHELSNPTESTIAYDLIYGTANVPKTDKDFFKFWGFDAKAQLTHGFGWIEGASHVSKADTRFIEYKKSSLANYLWSTKDVFKIEEGKDPLEFLQGNFTADGTEHIAGIPKHSYSLRKRGTAQVYLLAAGNGNRVEEAPVRLVEDYHRTLNQTGVINTASCVTCHTKGMQLPNVDLLQHYVVNGVEIYAKDKDKKDFVERFYTEVVTELERNNEDYAAFVECCNGLTTEVNAAYYGYALKEYIKDMTLEDVARELRRTPEEVQNAIAYASNEYIVLGPREAGAAHGFSMPRATFEEVNLKLREICDVWSRK